MNSNLLKTLAKNIPPDVAADYLFQAMELAGEVLEWYDAHSKIETDTPQMVLMARKLLYGSEDDPHVIKFVAK